MDPITTAAAQNVTVGQIYRDTYGDNRSNGVLNQRTIEIVEVLPNGVRAKLLTDVNGAPHKKAGRITTLMFRTLRAGYVQVS